MDIIIQNDGIVTPFNIQSSRETRFTLMPQTRDATDSKEAADGEIDFGTTLGMGEFTLHGIIEFDTISERNAIENELRKQLNECRNPQQISYEHSPDKYNIIRLTGRPEIIRYPHHLEIRAYFKSDPMWYIDGEELVTSKSQVLTEKIPKYIEIKSATGKRIAFLMPQADGLKECYADCRLNGESTLQFMLPANSPKLSALTPECEIWAGDKVYTILNDDAIDFERTEDNKLWAKVKAIEKWYELDSQYVEPYLSNDPGIPSPADLAVIIVSGGSDLSGGIYTVGSAGHALYAVLNGSGWTVGTVDVTGIHDLEMEKESRLALVKQIRNIWGGYLVWDSVNKIVHLRSGDTWQNYTGFQIRYKKNLKHINRTQSNRLVTKLYCFGHDDLDISSVNNGKKYITNNSYTPREYVGIYRNPDIYNAQELKDRGIAELSLICRPKYLYRVKIVDIRTLPEYSHENFVLGDMIDVIDPDIAPDSPRPRIIRHKYNLFMPWQCELELGDPEERLVESLKASFNTSGYIDETLTSRGQLPGYKLVDGSVEDVKIKSLTADKITAGTITASISMQSPYIYGGAIYGGAIYGGTITGTNITSTNDLYVGTQESITETKRIYFNNYMNIEASSDVNWVIKFNCGVLDFEGNIKGDWNFGTAGCYVSGLENHGYAKQSWVASQGYTTETYVSQALATWMTSHIEQYHS